MNISHLKNFGLLSATTTGSYRRAAPVWQINPSCLFKHPFDILEDTVEEKYYLSQEKVRRLIEDMEERKALLFEPDEKSLKAFRENRVKRAGNIKGVFEQTGRVYLPDGCCPTVTACGGGGQQPKILQVGDIHTGYGSSGVIYSPL